MESKGPNEKEISSNGFEVDRSISGDSEELTKK